MIDYARGVPRSMRIGYTFADKALILSRALSVGVILSAIAWGVFTMLAPIR